MTGLDIDLLNHFTTGRPPRVNGNRERTRATNRSIAVNDQGHVCDREHPHKATGIVQGHPESSLVTEPECLLVLGGSGEH
jgi:hypothetical protein